jgi:hypothetical protein
MNEQTHKPTNEEIQHILRGAPFPPLNIDSPEPGRLEGAKTGDVKFSRGCTTHRFGCKCREDEFADTKQLLKETLEFITEVADGCGDMDEANDFLHKIDTPRFRNIINTVLRID